MHTPEIRRSKTQDQPVTSSGKGGADNDPSGDAGVRQGRENRVGGRVRGNAGGRKGGFLSEKKKQCS